MPYSISTFRNTHIMKTSNTMKNDDNINGLIELLKLDTSNNNHTFLTNFRELKSQYQIIKVLCEPKGFFGSIAYAFKSDDARADRYKTIIAQLKTGKSSQQDTNTTTYFHNNLVVKESICAKIEQIKNEYYNKTYENTNGDDYKKDNTILEELSTFNTNVGYIPKAKIMENVQSESNNNVWHEYVKVNPKYRCIQQNRDSNHYNIEGTLLSAIQTELLSSLPLHNGKPAVI